MNIICTTNTLFYQATKYSKLLTKIYALCTKICTPNAMCVKPEGTI